MGVEERRRKRFVDEKYGMRSYCIYLYVCTNQNTLIMLSKATNHYLQRLARFLFELFAPAHLKRMRYHQTICSLKYFLP